MSKNQMFLATSADGISRAIHEGNGTWALTHHAPGRHINCLAVDPFHSEVIFAGTQTQGVLRSADGGVHWQPVGLQGKIVKAVAISPHEPGVLYAGMKPAAVFKSEDGGASWRELSSFHRIRGRRFWRSPAEPPDWRAYVMALSISPDDPQTIVAGIEFGAVVRSTDGGKTWSNHRKGALRDCHSLTFHTGSGDWVYEAGGGGAAVSRDGGVSWQQPRKGLDRRYGFACAADPARPEVWYVSAGPFGWKGVPQPHVDGAAKTYIYRSAGGAPWQRLSGGLPQPLDYMAYALVTDPGAPGHLYAGLSNGDVWHTADYGDNWQQLPFNLGRIHYRMIMLRTSA